MNEITRARLRLLVILIAVIVIVHVIVICVHVRRSRSAESPVPEPPVPTVPAAVTVPVASSSQAVPVSRAVPAKKTGFWSRLFGGGKEEMRPATVQPPPPPPPKPVWRYRRQETPPRFGQPFDYSNTLHGDLPAKVVPGSSGARSGFMVDLDSRNVLWEKNSDRPVPIASMVKMVTLLVTFDELEKNPALSLSSPVKISRTVLKVPRTGVIWLDPRETFPLSDLLKAVTIKSANDAATMVAEFIGGDVDTFIRRMNERAAGIGMTHSHFVSPCGLKDKEKGNSTSSAHDMVVVAEHLLEIPQVMQWSTTKQDSIREGEKKTLLTATNRLVNPRWPGVDGLKTGFTNDAGYCLTFTVLRDGRRIVGCVTGFKSARERDRFCRKLIDWGYERAAALN